MDLKRFYENISHAELFSAAKAANFPLPLIRALCCLYRAPRRVSWQGAISRLIYPNGTTVAGCSCATSLARLLLLATLRRASVDFKAVRLKNVIDDVSFHAVGGFQTVTRELAASFNQVAKAVRQVWPTNLETPKLRSNR